MFSIGVYVTSRYKSYNEFSAYMDGSIKQYLPVGKPSALVTGDYKSTNAGNGLVARYAFEHNIPLRRFATLWGKHNPTKSGKRNNAGVASNAQIVKDSNACILFWTPTSVAKWDFMSGGCRSFLRMCDEGHFARPVIKIKVDIYKPDITIEEPSAEISGEAPVDIGGSIPEMPSSTPVPMSSPAPISGGSGGGGGIPPPSPSVLSNLPSPDETENPETEINGEQGGDNIGNIDGEELPPDTASNLISQMPLDITGDGEPDVVANVADTNGDGTPDSILRPVDADNNGTIDAFALDPIPTADQIVQQNQQIQQQVQSSPPTVDDEDNQQKVQQQ